MRQMKQSRLRAAAYLLLAALLISAGRARPAAAQVLPVERFERTLPLAAGGMFSLSNVNGSVQIEGWNREEVQIAAVKSSTGDPEELSRVGIVITQSPQGIYVETRYPPSGSAEVSVEYRVRVPAHVRLGRVSAINGSLSVRDVTGMGSLMAINGNVSLARGAGLFSARATNGNVTLELVSLESGFPASDAPRPAAPGAAITAQTVNGSVDVALPADAGAELEARTQNGDFTSDLPLLTSSSAAGRLIHSRIGPGGPALLLRTVNGSIRLRITPPLV